MWTIAEDENKSFGEIFVCFDNQMLNLRQIMNWPITNKPYSICSEDGKVKANTKPLFRNKLQSLCPIAPTNLAPKCVSASVVVAMRLVQIIPIKSTELPSYSTWAKNLFAYIENLPEIIYLLSLIIIIVKVISSLACRNKNFKVLQKETSAAWIKFYLMPMNGQSFCPIEQTSFSFVTCWQIILQVEKLQLKKYYL